MNRPCTRDDGVRRRNPVKEYWGRHFSPLDHTDPLYHGVNSIEAFYHFQTTDFDSGLDYNQFVQATRASTSLIHITQLNNTINYMVRVETVEAAEFFSRQPQHETNNVNNSDSDQEMECVSQEPPKETPPENTVTPNTPDPPSTKSIYNPKCTTEASCKIRSQKRKAVSDFWGKHYLVEKKLVRGNRRP